MPKFEEAHGRAVRPELRLGVADRLQQMGRDAARQTGHDPARIERPTCGPTWPTIASNSRASPHRQLTTEFEFDHDSTSCVLSRNLRLSFDDRKSYPIREL
jgi:hypothetical protein